jgi:GNAT superfamily N-acetyltransferase
VSEERIGREPALREATNGDREALVALHRRAITHAGSDPDDVPGNYLADVEGTFHDDGGTFHVLESGDGVVAMGGAKRVDEATVELVRIAVDPDHHREGLGSRMVAELERFARETGYERVELETTERQAAARELYASRGYRETGRRQVLGYTVVGFAKDL